MGSSKPLTKEYWLPPGQIRAGHYAIYLKTIPLSLMARGFAAQQKDSASAPSGPSLFLVFLSRAYGNVLVHEHFFMLLLRCSK